MKSYKHTFNACLLRISHVIRKEAAHQLPFSSERWTERKTDGERRSSWEKMDNNLNCQVAEKQRFFWLCVTWGWIKTLRSSSLSQKHHPDRSFLRHQKPVPHDTLIYIDWMLFYYAMLKKATACCLHSSTVIKYFIPSFGGQSYLAFQTMSAYHTVRIAMEFRASEMTGILLYNGQDSKKDFISLALVNGRVELRWALWELRMAAASSAGDSVD